MKRFGHRMSCLCLALLVTPLRGMRVADANLSTATLNVDAPIPDKMTYYLSDTAETPTDDCTDEVETSLAYRRIGETFKFCGGTIFVYTNYTKDGEMISTTKKRIVRTLLFGEFGSSGNAMRLERVQKMIECPSLMYDTSWWDNTEKYGWLNRDTDAPTGGMAYKMSGETMCTLYKLILPAEYSSIEVSGAKHQVKSKT